MTLPLQGKEERRHLYEWMTLEEEYVAAKFDDQRNGHDDEMRSVAGFNDFWIRQVVQYYDRAYTFLIGAKAARENGDHESARHLEQRAQQAMAKAMMTAKGMVESSIRVFGPLPTPGVPSGEVFEWPT